MRLHILIVGILISVAIASPEGIEDEVVDYLRKSHSSAELHVVTPEIRTEVIEQLKQYARGYDPRLHREMETNRDRDAWIALVRLKEPGAVDDLVQGIKDWAMGGTTRWAPVTLLPRIRDPDYVLTFSEDFLRDDGAEITYVSDGDIGSFEKPRSTEVAINVLKLIAACPEFTQETRRWAQAYGDIWRIRRVGAATFRERLREWWNENRQFFDAKTYEKVKPATSLPTELDISSTSSENELAPIPPGPPKGSSTTLSRTPQSTPPLFEVHSIWVLIAVSLPLILVTFAFWKYRKKDRGSGSVFSF